MTLTYVEFNSNVIRTARLEDNEYNIVGNAIVAVGTGEFFDGKTAVPMTAMDKLQPLPIVGAYVVSETKTADELQELFKQDILTLAKQRLNDATTWYNNINAKFGVTNKPRLSITALATIEEDKKEYEIEKRALEESTTDDDVTAILTIEEIEGKLEAYEDVEHAKDEKDLDSRVQSVKEDKATYLSEYEEENGHAFDPEKEYTSVDDDGFSYAKDLAHLEGYLTVIHLLDIIGY